MAAVVAVHHAVQRRTAAGQEDEGGGGVQGSFRMERQESKVRQAFVPAAITVGATIAEHHRQKSQSALLAFTKVQELAATKIARAWLLSKTNKYIARKVFIDCLELEDAVCVGVVRLLLFSLIFVLLIFSGGL
eukprot:663190-Rhodomonas_salina.1